MSGNSINLIFKNYDIEKELEFTYKIESLLGNEAEKSEIKKSKEQLELILDDKEFQLIRKLSVN